MRSLLVFLVLAGTAFAAPAIWSGDATAKGPPKLLWKIKPRTMDLISANNDNTKFRFWIVFPRQADHETFIQLDGKLWASGGMGHDDSASQAQFDIDRATAEKLAKAFKLPLHERTRLDQGLTASWTLPGKASTRADDPINVTLHVTNGGKTTVGFMIGGRQRGPRDNRFSFAIKRNGRVITIKDAPDFGGIGYYKKLAPGESTDLTCDLRSWADLTVPGHYAIDATFDGELAKDGEMPQTAADQANVWDVPLTGQAGLLVQ